MEKKRLLLGLLYLAGAWLSAYFLLWYGGWTLFTAVIATAIGDLANREQPREDFGGVAVIGAVMVSIGFCLAVGLLTLGIRRLAGKTYPNPRSVKIFLVFSAIMLGSVTLGAWRLTAIDPIPTGYADLAGIWRRADDTSQTCRFNPDGTIDYWSAGIGRGRTGRWARSGRTITIRDDRDWRAGMISPNLITYAMPVTSTEKTPATVRWLREMKP